VATEGGPADRAGCARFHGHPRGRQEIRRAFSGLESAAGGTRSSPSFSLSHVVGGDLTSLFWSVVCAFLVGAGWGGVWVLGEWGYTARDDRV